MNPPLIDAATPQALVQAVRLRLGWRAEQPDSLLEALLAVYGHYAQHLSQRLNGAPQRQLDAFVDLLRPARFAAVPAQTVLVFKPAAGSRANALVVPAGTQVTGATPPGASEPVLFETLTPVTLTRAQLARAFEVDAGQRHWGDATAVGGNEGLSRSALEHAAPVDRAVHVAVPEAAIAAPPSTLHLRATLDEGLTWPEDAEIQWSLRTDSASIPVAPEADGTAGLSRTGELVLRDLPAWPATSLAGRTAHWLTCRIVGRGANGLPMPLVPARVAVLQAATWVARRDLQARPVEAAFFGTQPLDVSRDFYPLGERPRFGDAVLLKSEAFALPGAQVNLDIALTNASDGDSPSPLPRVATDHPASIEWDCWTARGWVTLAPQREATQGFTRSGTLRLTMPADAAATTLNGAKGGFLRARLTNGDYAVEPGAAVTSPQAAAAALAVPRHRPPSIAKIAVTASVQSAALEPDAIATERDLQATLLEAPFLGGVAVHAPFADEPPALYLGLRNTQVGASERFQFVLQARPARAPLASGAEAIPKPPRWQYRGADGWQEAHVRSLPGTASDVVTAVVEIGADWQPWWASLVDPTLCWLRLVSDPDGGAAPALKRVMLNAATAAQQRTVVAEVLGSSSGAPAQVHPLAHGRVIGEPELEVCEPGALSPADRQSLLDVDALRVVPASGRLAERNWVRWRRVDDLGQSGPLARDYVLDAEEGRIRFGNGRNGRIPPSGPNNLVMRHYRSGGGAAGNGPAHSVEQLRSTLPYVDSVAQPEGAAGGQDAESPAAARASATTWLRHRDRAVGPDDYEDLACRAAPDMLRAKCLAGRDVGTDALGVQVAPGCVSLALLPRDSADPAPRPSTVLMARVRAFLRERGCADVRLHLCAPMYIRIDVDAEVVAQAGSDGAALALACEERLARFLHPVHGGPRGDGWTFGEWPHASSVRAALKGLAGLGEVRHLRLRTIEQQAGAKAAAHALVCAGRGTVRTVS